MTGHGEIVLEDSLEAAFDRVGNGYVVTDRRDMLEDKGKNQAELLVEALGAQPSAGEDNTWLSATCLGYAAITSFGASRRSALRISTCLCRASGRHGAIPFLAPVAEGSGYGRGSLASRVAG